jgi:hypothetical protein
MDYEPDTGRLVWKVIRKKVKRGGEAGCGKSHGYRTVGIDGKLYMAHRVVWLHVHGRWPTHHIDHINGDRLDNRIANLREATNAQNMQNVHSRKRGNSHGFTGVAQTASAINPWTATIRANGKRRSLGMFRTAEEAGAAYQKAREELHPFRPNQGQA